MEPVRTCIGCRASGPRSSLSRVVASNGAVVVDSSATRAGRGAWIHSDAICIETAVKRRAFGRALRVSTPLDTGGVLAVLTQIALAEKQKGLHSVLHEEQAD